MLGGILELRWSCGTLFKQRYKPTSLAEVSQWFLSCVQSEFLTSDSMKQEDRGKIKDLFSSHFRWTTVLLWFIWWAIISVCPRPVKLGCSFSLVCSFFLPPGNILPTPFPHPCFTPLYSVLAAVKICVNVFFCWSSSVFPGLQMLFHTTDWCCSPQSCSKREEPVEVSQYSSDSWRLHSQTFQALVKSFECPDSMRF